MDRRTCARCRVQKPTSDFFRDASQSSGYSYACRNCDKAKTKDVTLRRKYGISLVEYDALLALQGGICAVCQQPETDTWRGAVKLLAVDHDHTTGRVRGLLCARCNRSIGVMGDDPDKLRAAATYLETNGRLSG